MKLIDLPLTPVNLPYDQETIHQLLSTFCATGRHSINFCQLSVQPEDLPSTSCSAGRHSINFFEVSVRPGDLLSTSFNNPCGQETFWPIPSIFCTAERPSVNFHQLFCVARRCYVNFRVAGRPSVNICKIFMPPGDLLSTSDNFLRPQDFP